MTYSELKTAIAAALGRRTDLGSEIPGFVDRAEDRIANELRAADMVKQMKMEMGLVDTSGTSEEQMEGQGEKEKA